MVSNFSCCTNKSEFYLFSVSHGILPLRKKTLLQRNREFKQTLDSMVVPDDIKKRKSFQAKEDRQVNE